MASYILSKIRNQIINNPNHSVWLGLDVHKKSYSIACKVGENQPITWRDPANPAGLIQQLKTEEIEPSGACYEAGPTGFSLARALIEADIPVIVAAPNKVPRSVSPGSKTDRLDCIKLVEFASKGLIKPIAIPSIRNESERALLRRRHQLTDEIRRCKQRIRALFLYHGHDEPEELEHWSKKTLEILLQTSFPLETRQVLQSYLRELKFLMNEREIVERQLQRISRKSPHAKVIEALMSVPGVGFITAMTFHMELFNPERFNRAEEVSSYLGLAPTVRQSGEKHPRGRLVPVGQVRLRSLLIEASWMWVKYDVWAGSYYRKRLSRSGLAQKAIAAVARRLGIILWRLSIEKRAYYPKTA